MFMVCVCVCVCVHMCACVRACVHCLCSLVVRASDYRSRGHELDSLRYQIFNEALGLERVPMNLVSIIEELLER
jgi:hypothetical protein